MLQTQNNDNGIVSIPAHRTVDAIVATLTAALAAKGVKLFALIDHSGEAATAGLPMPNTKLLIFGNPAAGTPAMVASPTLALDLPLKILVSEDVAGTVRVAYYSTEYLRRRHNVPAEVVAGLRVIDALAAQAAE